MRLILPLSVVLVLCVASVAQAQEHPDPESMDANARHTYAVNLTQQANDVYRAGQFQDAADLYLLAYEYEQTPVLLFNTGRCYHRLEMGATAVEFYQMAIDTGELDGETAQRARNYIQEIRNAVVTSAMQEEINVALDRAAAAEGNGNYAQAARFYLEAYEVPGDPIFSDLNILLSHADALLRAEDYEGAIAAYQRVKDQRTANDAQIARADQGISDAEEAQAAASVVVEEPVIVTPPSGGGGLTGLQITGIVVAGLGAGALVGGVILDAGLSGTIDDYEAAAERGDFNEYESLANDINSKQTVATILYIGGGVALGAGIVLLLVGGSDDEPNPADASRAEDSAGSSLIPDVIPTGYGLSLHWDF